MLKTIVANKKKQLRSLKVDSDIGQLLNTIETLPPTISLKDSLMSEDKVSIIAEIKRRSPSRGILNDDFDAITAARMYESAGARAVSVVTEDTFFGGSINDLKAVKKSVGLPVLRKDFIIDEYQIYESRAAGADAILLIVRLLRPDELSYLCYLARQLELDVIAEVHTLHELDRALDLCPNLVGINNRNLDSFETNLKTFETIIPHIPYGTLGIGESGISERADMIYLEEWGADAALIGESIVTSPDPYKKICELRGVAS